MAIESLSRFPPLMLYSPLADSEADIDVSSIVRQVSHWLTVVTLTAIAGVVLVLVPVRVSGVVATTTPSPFVTAPVVQGDLAIKVTATGTVEPVRLVEVSTELSGTIAEVLVQTNDRVRVGQVLAVLDTSTTRLEHKRAEAAVRAARARLAEVGALREASSRELSRKTHLARQQLTTARDLDQATLASEQSKSKIEALRAELALAEADLELSAAKLSKARIISPIDGVVLRRSVEPGQTVAAALAAPVLFRLAPSLDQMQLKVDVDEADAMRVATGQTATFQLHALRDQKLEAVVEKLFLGPEIVQGVVTYKGILRFDNRPLGLRPGMTVSADITVDAIRDGLLVPNAALRFVPPDGVTVIAHQDTGSRSAALIMAGSANGGAAAPRPSAARKLHVERDGHLVAIVVEAGVTDGTLTHVRSPALKAGDAVVVDLANPSR